MLSGEYVLFQYHFPVYREVRTFRLSGAVSKLFKFDYIEAIILLSVWVNVMSVLTLITSGNCSVNKVIYLESQHCMHLCSLL